MVVRSAWYVVVCSFVFFLPSCADPSACRRQQRLPPFLESSFFSSEVVVRGVVILALGCAVLYSAHLFCVLPFSLTGFQVCVVEGFFSSARRSR